MPNKPIRSSSHIKEDKSKRKFEETIHPHFVTGWTVRDYGIDAVVEITSLVNQSEDVELDSKCFLVQLKSTAKLKIIKNSISFQIPVKKIVQWHVYNIPVLFVLYSIEMDQFHYVWIDDGLISDIESRTSNWSVLKNVTIRIPMESILTNETVSFFREYVATWKQPSRRDLKHGKYFDLRDNLIQILDEYRSINEPFAFESIKSEIANSYSEIEKAIYRIAITGLSRVGKSSLINALIGRTISPVGFFQTTGVPIQIIPGAKDGVKVFFKDSTSKDISLKEEEIAFYASQELNEDNKRNVKLIVISLKNKNLERGISFYDIPGLDDPDDDILDYTLQTVQTVNAIIYVIDASPAQHGGYIFKNDFKKHITNFSQSQDKVFLVFNKTDQLAPEILSVLKERVEVDLRKHSLDKSVGSKVYYVNTIQKLDNNSLEELNTAIWDFILHENKFGIVKLSSLTQSIIRSSQKFITLLNARHIDLKKRDSLEESMSNVKARFPNLVLTINQRFSEFRSSLSHSLDSKEGKIIAELERGLTQIPIGDSLPTTQDIRRYLHVCATRSMELCNNEFERNINQIMNHIDTWIENELNQVSEILSNESNYKIVDISEIDTFDLPPIDISSAWGMGLISFFAGAIVATPIAGIFTGIAGFLATFITSSEERRAKRIVNIVASAREKNNSIFGLLRKEYEGLLVGSEAQLKRYSQAKLDLYFKDISEQLSKLDVPISANELELYENTFRQIDSVKANLIELDIELRSYYYST